MEIKLLLNGKGLLSDRGREKSTEPMKISFTGTNAPLAVLVPLKDGRKYITVRKGTVTLPAPELLEDSVALTVVRTDGGMEQWVCEPIYHYTEGENEVYCPDDFDCRKSITDLILDNERIRKEFNETKKTVEELIKKIDEMMEGYDV